MTSYSLPSHHLDVTLTQAVQVGTDAHGATSNVGQREGVLDYVNPVDPDLGCVQRLLQI